MSIMLVIGDVHEVDRGIWTAQLAPSEVLRLNDAKPMRTLRRSIVAVSGVEFDGSSNRLFVDPSKASVLNVGTTDQAVIIDVGPEDHSGTVRLSEPNLGDEEFLRSCQRLLGEELCGMAKQLLAELRQKHQGHLHEGQARKWVNGPRNFVAITIQPRDRSLAVHVKGNPDEFVAPSLDIRPDRPSYSRFKLERHDQLSDAIQVVLSAGMRTRI
jgi:hypothetical protein